MGLQASFGLSTGSMQQATAKVFVVLIKNDNGHISDKESTNIKSI